jgi:Zn2+/Cd2+-exporting ATPase
MEKILRKEIVLEGLDCAQCGAKIEEEVGKLEGINLSTLNFVNKTLSIELTSGYDFKNAIENINKVVKNLEPDVVVKEKIISRNERKILLMTGICCRPCTEKIEKGVRNIADVKNANFDFDNGKLIIEYVNQKNEKSIVAEAKKISKEIISGIKIKDEERQRETLNKLKIVRISFGIVIFALALFGGLSFVPQLILYILSYILIGGDVLLKAGKNILKGNVFDENFLMSIATIGAFAIKEFPEAVSVMLFYKVGMILQDMAVNNSRKSIKSLLNVKPEYANIKEGTDLKKVSPYEVKVGDKIVVKPGEKIPLDGFLLHGTSAVDTSSLTGESLPKEVAEGDEVLAGFINKTGLIEIQVEKIFNDSAINKVFELVENSNAKKSVTENFITKFAKVYTPIVVGLALIIAIVPPLFTDFNFIEWIRRALIFLVVSCPCALVISIPLGFFGGIGSASKKGILIKGSNFLEALNNVETIIFDKTGTLTEGSFKVGRIVSENGFRDEEVLEYAAIAEIFSNHPIAFSIVKEYKNGIDKNKITDYTEIGGFGIKAVYDGKEILCGNDKLFIKEKIDFKKANETGTVCYIAVDKKYAGFIVISDKIRDNAVETIKKLKENGIKKIVMLTGDNNLIASKVGAELGVDEVCSELLPDGKVKELERYEKERSTNSKIMFVGDGINDAPVIARSDIGVAMGGLGSDAAIESADIVLMNDNISKITEAMKISRKTRKIVIQNIVFAMGIKVLVLVLGTAGIATMWEAVFADVGVALIAIVNSMRSMKV